MLCLYVLAWNCSLKVRVMPSCWFVLLRYWLRVDGVTIRLRDTRCFHAFGTSVVIREHSYKEAPCPKPEPISFPPSESAKTVVVLNCCWLIDLCLLLLVAAAAGIGSGLYASATHDATARGSYQRCATGYGCCWAGAVSTSKNGTTI